MKIYKFLLFLSIIFLTGCDNGKPKYTTIYLLVDVTDKSLKDSQILVNSVPKILTKMGVSATTGGNAGGEVKIFVINDLSDSPSVSVKLNSDPGGLLGTNPIDRTDEIKAFQADLSASLNKVLDGVDWNKDKSKIYQNICREVNNLNKVAGEKTFIVFSDMLENSELFSLYKDSSKLINDIKNLDQNILKKDCDISDLSQTDMYFISNRNKQNDQLVNSAERFWRALFQIKNVKKVTFDAELNIQ
jgi:hypothetical protein